MNDCAAACLLAYSEQRFDDTCDDCYDDLTTGTDR